MATVARKERIADLVSIGLILFGAVLCLIANSRLQEIGKLSYRNPGPRDQSALTAADHARYLAYGGVAFIVVGFVTGIGTAIRVARRDRGGPIDPAL